MMNNKQELNDLVEGSVFLKDGEKHVVLYTDFEVIDEDENLSAFVVPEQKYNEIVDGTDFDDVHMRELERFGYWFYAQDLILNKA